MVVELIFQWYWLIDRLIDHQYCIYLTNPTAIKQYSEPKPADHNSDTAWIPETPNSILYRRDISIQKMNEL